MLKLYGKKQSRAGRCLWTLEELGLPYSLIPSDPAEGQTKTTDFLALNPLGKVPVLVDGDFILTESIAINAYLVSQSSNSLWPDDRRRQARIHQWTSWAVTEIEFYFTVIVREMRRAGSGEPNKNLIQECLAALETTLVPFESYLGDQRFVAGKDFTVGDINAAFPVIGLSTRLEMTKFPAVSDWLARTTERDAWKRVLAIEENALL